MHEPRKRNKAKDNDSSGDKDVSRIFDNLDDREKNIQVFVPVLGSIVITNITIVIFIIVTIIHHNVSTKNE